MELSKVYTILAINESPDRLDSINDILQRAGYDVLKATNPTAACKLAFTDHPDLILIEESNTEQDENLVRRLREIDKTSPIPILLTTSAQQLSLVKDSEAAYPYPSDSLQIPYTEFQLVIAVTRLIDANCADRIIHQRERRYRDLFENANDIVYTHDLKGRYTSLNKRGRELTGYTGEEAATLESAQIAGPDDIALAQRHFELKLRRGTDEPTTYEMNIFTKDGRTLPVEINSQLIFDEHGHPIGVQGIARDISGRKEHEAALREAHQQVIEANARAILEYQYLLGRIGALAQMLGTAREISTIFDELVEFANVSVPCSTLVLALYESEHNHVVPQFVWSQDAIIDLRSERPLTLSGGTPGKAVLTKKIIISSTAGSKFLSLDPTRNGPTPPPTTMTVPMITNERVVGLLEIHTATPGAFTEEHKTAISMAANLAANGIDNLRLLERDQQRDEKLKQAQKMEALGRLAGGVAHDFNNIITAIYGYCDLAIKDLDDKCPAAAELIGGAKECGHRAQLFINQLNGFSRNQILDPRSLDLNNAVRQFNNVIVTLFANNVEVRYILDEHIPPVNLAPVQIDQIILNLAVNSRDAMPNGGRITIETRVVNPDQPSFKAGATKDPQQPQVLLIFTDTGQGMDGETQRHIFEPYFTTKGHRGTGLGLSMVYGTVKQAGGTTTVSSQLGKGTTFTIRLPAAIREVELTPQERRPAIPASRKDGYTVLVVEDDKRVQHTLSIALKGAGYEVFTADNGQQGWEVFQRDHKLIDLVITDLLMPELNGTDLAIRMKELSEETRILYISGYPRNTIIEDGILSEDVELMQKPFTHAEILRRIDDMLHGQRQPLHA